MKENRKVLNLDHIIILWLNTAVQEKIGSILILRIPRQS